MEHLLTIGETAERSGFATSAIRFYERQGLVHADRTASGQRRFRRDVLRRLAFIRIAQRITLLGALQSGLSECIGCGCLSLRTCALANPDDVAAGSGAGPQYLL